MPELAHEVKRQIEFPAGGTVTVTVRSSDPIDEKDYLILQPQAAIEMSYCLANMANALRPPDCPEVLLEGAPSVAE